MAYSVIPGQDPNIRAVRLETPTAKPGSATPAKTTQSFLGDDPPPRVAVQSSLKIYHPPKRRW